MPASITRTALTAAVSDASSRVLSVISATGFLVGYGLYVDREYMSITAITGTLISVRRGASGTRATPHLAGASVFVAPPNYFTTYDRSGAGTYANEQASPYINISNGNVWSVLGGLWVKNNTYATTTTNYGLSPQIWADCPIAQMLADPGFGCIDGDDFTGGVVATAHKYTLVGDTGTFAQVAGVPHGVVRVDSTAADEKEATVTANAVAGIVKADALSTWWYETRVKLSRATTDIGVYVGLAGEGASEIDNAFIVDATAALKVVDSIGFRILAPTATTPVWDTVMQLAGGALVSIKASAAATSTDYIKLGMKSVAGTVTFYINGTPLADTKASSAANFPLDQIMTPTWAVKNTGGATISLDIDWWKVAQTRLAN